jgi:hypothetical protein
MPKKIIHFFKNKKWIGITYSKSDELTRFGVNDLDLDFILIHLKPSNWMIESLRWVSLSLKNYLTTYSLLEIPLEPNHS